MSRVTRTNRERGFTLIELIVVAAIIAIMVAAAIPNIRGFLRNYQLGGAARQVIAEVQSARMKAVHAGNRPIFLVTVGPGQFRWVVGTKPGEQVGTNPGDMGDERLGPLQQLPGQVEFQPAAVANSGACVRFNNLGGFCNPGASGTATCALPVGAWCRAAGERNCATNSGTFIAPDGAVPGGLTITVINRATGLTRTVFLAPGGSARTRQ